MMLEEEVKEYRERLTDLIRSFHEQLMTAMAAGRIFDMKESSRKFDMIVARLDTLDTILKN